MRVIMLMKREPIPRVVFLGPVKRNISCFLD